jgi:hypothetical protein
MNANAVYLVYLVNDTFWPKVTIFRQYCPEVLDAVWNIRLYYAVH